MDYAQFQAAAAQAVTLHQRRVGGPVLVSLREEFTLSVLSPGTRLYYPTYAATLGHWSATPLYFESPEEALTVLRELALDLEQQEGEQAAEFAQETALAA